MTKNEFEIVEKDETRKFIAGHRSMTGWSWGEYLGVHLAQDNNKLKVSYKSAKRLKGNISATDWEDELKEQIIKKYSDTIISCND